MIKKFKSGQVVKILKSNGHWSSSWIGEVGTVTEKDPLYKGAWFVKFEDGFLASYYKNEVEIVA